MALRPMRMSRDELRLAIVGPDPRRDRRHRHRRRTRLANPPSRVIVSRHAGAVGRWLLVALGVGVLRAAWLGARYGYGPWATSAACRFRARARRPRHRSVAGCGRARVSSACPGCSPWPPSRSCRWPSTRSATSRGSTWATSGSPAFPRATPARPSSTCRSRCTTTTTTCAPRTRLRRRGGPGRSTSSRSGSSRTTTPAARPPSSTTPATWCSSGSRSRPLRGSASWRGSGAASPLTFVVIAIAALWLPWARIDRATFQYHIFTTLPFAFLALAYFLAELWHGPSARTWALARVAAAIAVIGPPLLWLLRLPLCGIARTEEVNAGTEVCANLSRELALTDIQVIGLVLALGGLVAAAFVFLARTYRPAPEGTWRSAAPTRSRSVSRCWAWRSWSSVPEFRATRSSA